MSEKEAKLWAFRWFLVNKGHKWHSYGMTIENIIRTCTLLLEAYALLPSTEIAHACLTTMRILRDDFPVVWEEIYSSNSDALSTWDTLRLKENEHG